MNNTTAPQKNLIAAAIMWWIVVSLVYSLLLTNILKNFNLTPIEIITDALLNNLLLFGCSALIINNMRYYLPGKERYWYILIISLALSCICTFIARVFLWLIFKADASYMQTLSESVIIRICLFFLLIGCMATMSLLWYSLQEQKEMNARKSDAERLSREAELFKLRQQLQPHFLFNSLNSISALTGTQPEKARHMIEQLSDFLRGTLKKEEHQWNSLLEEFKYLELYLDIEKVRFGHRLQTEIMYDDETLQMKLPSLLLQPLVENAIKFGLYDTIGEVSITISAKKENENLIVTVQNPFDAETAQPLKGTGFGLASIRRRLYLLFARHDLLEIKTDTSNFITTVIIPKIIMEN